MGVHTVFSVDGSLYHQWQADLLAYSYQKAGQLGALTRLWSAWKQPPPFIGRTFQTAPYSPHPTTGDVYPPYNKPMALVAWLQESPPIEETVLVLDPDCIFVAACHETVNRGCPIAHPIGYLDAAANSTLLGRTGLSAEAVQAIGIPLLIHRDDLARLAPMWAEQTAAIRNDPIGREVAGWLAEMWAYVIAAASIGLCHQVRELACWQMEDRNDLPLIHYCYSSMDVQERWRWDKRTYRPWGAIPDPPLETPRATKALIGMLNEWAALQEHEIIM